MNLVFKKTDNNRDKKLQSNNPTVLHELYLHQVEPQVSQESMIPIQMSFGKADSTAPLLSEIIK